MAKDTRMDTNGWVAGLWFAGWLFCIGYLHLGWLKSLLGIVIWPYYLGAKFGG